MHTTALYSVINDLFISDLVLFICFLTGNKIDATALSVFQASFVV